MFYSFIPSRIPFVTGYTLTLTQLVKKKRQLVPPPNDKYCHEDTIEPCLWCDPANDLDITRNRATKAFYVFSKFPSFCLRLSRAREKMTVDSINYGYGIFTTHPPLSIPDLKTHIDAGVTEFAYSMHGGSIHATFAVLFLLGKSRLCPSFSLKTNKMCTQSRYFLFF